MSSGGEIDGGAGGGKPSAERGGARRGARRRGGGEGSRRDSMMPRRSNAQGAGGIREHWRGKQAGGIRALARAPQ